MTFRKPTSQIEPWMFQEHRGEKTIRWILIALLIAGVIGFAHIFIEDDKAWTAFKSEHVCKPEASTIPGKTAWLCDDGQTHYRN